MKKALKIFLLILFGVFLLFSIIILSINYSVKDIKLNHTKLINLERTVSFLDTNGTVFSNESNGVTVTELENIPTHTQKAFISIEDKRFYSHNGIDYRALMRAIINNLRSFSLKEGASTISQQLIKNTHLSNEKTFKRKLQEIKLTKELEKIYNKDEILEKYLNTIYFGDNCYGITSAARHYFDKLPCELNVNESAVLAGIIKAPSNYSPLVNEQKCNERKNVVLKEMYLQGYINQNDYEKYKALPIEIKSSSSVKEYNYTYLVRNELNNIINNSPYENSNLTIETTFDSGIQNIIEKNILNYSDVNCNKSVVLMDKHGKIVAYYSTCGNVNRQLGSIIKPIAVYAPAIQNDIVTSYTILEDKKTDFNGYSPSNYNDKYYGNISVKNSLACSSNVCAAKLLNYVGVKNAAKYIKMTDVKVCNDDLSLSLALGATKYGSPLTDITAAYNVFINEGNYYSPTCINQINKNLGQTLYKNTNKTVKIFDFDTVSIMNDMLKNVVENGTAKKLSFSGLNLYAKTGTVGTKNGNSDAYIISYNNDYILGVWFGENGTLMNNSITGGTLPSTLANDIWKEIYKDKTPPLEIENSADIIETYIDKISYEQDNEIFIADNITPERYKIKAIFKKSSIPKNISKRFSCPEIQKPQLTIKNNEIFIKLCLTEYCDALIYRIENGQKKLVYDTKNNLSEFVVSGLKYSSTYQYIVIPYVENNGNINYGKEIKLEKIKTPNGSFGDGWWCDDFN